MSLLSWSLPPLVALALVSERQKREVSVRARWWWVKRFGVASVRGTMPDCPTRQAPTYRLKLGVGCVLVNLFPAQGLAELLKDHGGYLVAV